MKEAPEEIKESNNEVFSRQQWSTGLLTHATRLYIIMTRDIRITRECREDTADGRFQYVWDTVSHKAHGSSVFTVPESQAGFILSCPQSSAHRHQWYEPGNKGKETRHILCL